jgi:hypothetical protein
MLNELDRAAATPADTGAARPPISKTLQIAESEREINGFRPGADAHILPSSACQAIWQGGSGHVRIGP